MMNEFIEILHTTGSQKKDRENLFTKLESQYSDPNRYYHTIDHISDMVSGLKEIKDKVKNFTSIYLAIWFHDAHYDTKGTSNEEESADLAAVELQKLNLPSLQIKPVCEMILSTKWHLPYPNTEDCKFMLDLDLRILGKAPDEYEKYSQNIRKEYSWVSESDYKSGRAQILKNFLTRDRIYYTDHFKENFEKQARENLLNELDTLK